MKKILCVLSLLLFLGIAGCSSKTDDASEIHEKLKKAGYTIKLDKDAGTEVAYINLTLNEDDIFPITLMVAKNKGKVDTIVYQMETDHGKTNNTSVSYWVNENKNVGSIKELDEIVCVGYDLDEGKYVDDSTSAIGDGCDTNEKDALRALIESRDEYLKKIGVSLEDLESFGNWYYTENN